MILLFYNNFNNNAIYKIKMNNILIIILGCSLLNILHDRIFTTVEHVSKITDYQGDGKILSSSQLSKINKVNQINLVNQYHIDWILTGGIKEQKKANQKTESEIMYEELLKYNFPNSNYIFDYNSTNTAENFIFVSNYLQQEKEHTYKNYSNIYVVTSDFHQPRANMILSKIIPNNNFTWVVAPLETEHLRFWEKYHIPNVDRDVERALLKNFENSKKSEMIKDEL